MGQCIVCKDMIRLKKEDLSVENRGEKEDRKKNMEEICSKEGNYGRFIFLQRSIKKFVNKKKLGLNKSKKKTQPQSIVTNQNTSTASNRFFQPSSNAYQDSKVMMFRDREESNADNYQNHNRNVKGTQISQTANNVSSIIIPAVKADFQENSLLLDDPFLKEPTNLIDNDPRNEKNNNVRKKYPLITEYLSSYIGEWMNKMRDGIGIYSRETAKYIGMFKNNKIWGFGILNLSEGDSYSGMWENQQPKGIGIYKTKKDASYQGYWDNEKQNGFGLEKWPKGSHYQGEYKNGNKEGYGELNFENNGGYQGEFEGGNISGLGTFYFKDRRQYQGEWKNNKMHGYGTILWPDGKFYEGEFIDDKKEGFGVFYSHKKIYMGNWKNSLLSGDTIIIEGDKIRKQYWENGKASRNLDQTKTIFFEKYINEIIKYKKERDSQMEATLNVNV